MLPSDARAALEAATRWMIAERDSLYETITDSEGNIPDDDDGAYLREMDKVIDALRAVLAKYSEGEDPCLELLERAKFIKAKILDPMWGQRADWYQLQAAIAKVDQLYNGGTSS